METLSTSEMSRASGLSLKALRLYHDKGLLVPAQVDSGSGYRRYDSAQVDRGQRIALLRRLDMPLTEIAKVLDAPAGTARDLVMAWWSDRERQRAEARLALDVVAEQMTAEDAYGSSRLGFGVSRRQTAESKIASIGRTVDQSTLVPTFIADVLTIRHHLARAGASFGDEFWVLYHQPVGPGAPGEIETCVPYGGTIDPVDVVRLRLEPASTQLFVSVKQRDCRYPAIIPAFNAVIHAAQTPGPVGSPREIYPVPWSDALPDAVMAEVSIPIESNGSRGLCKSSLSRPQRVKFADANELTRTKVVGFCISLLVDLALRAGHTVWVMDLDFYAQHSPYSDPGENARLLEAVSPTPENLHASATKSIVHYRDDPGGVTSQQRTDIDRRWMRNIMAAIVERHDGGLEEVRPPENRVGGCCRDHSLLAVSVLREHHVPARMRVGFADYFRPGFRHDHVVVEQWDSNGRWVRSDPELSNADFAFDVHDMPTGEGAPFETASEAWLAYRSGRNDLACYGVANMPELMGPGFVQGYVVKELAFLMGSEVLLWDVWEGMTTPNESMEEPLVALTDQVAGLMVAHDQGSVTAATDLVDLWNREETLRPGPTVFTWSPNGRFGKTDLERCTTTWS